MQPILKPPLVYALLIKGAAKSPTKPSPSPHTHTPTHTQTPHTKQNSWNCSDWRGPLRKTGHREWGETTTEEKKKRVKGGKNIYRINLSEFHWLTSRCGPVTRQVPALPPSLPPSHSGNYDSYYRGRTGEETGIREGRRIVNERPEHPGTPIVNRTTTEKHC